MTKNVGTLPTVTVFSSEQQPCWSISRILHCIACSANENMILRMLKPFAVYAWLCSLFHRSMASKCHLCDRSSSPSTRFANRSTNLIRFLFVHMKHMESRGTRYRKPMDTSQAKWLWILCIANRRRSMQHYVIRDGPMVHAKWMNIFGMRAEYSAILDNPIKQTNELTKLRRKN